MPGIMTTHTLISSDLLPWLHRWDRVLLDLGTGDGAFARHRAQQNPNLGVIALDLRLDRLPRRARRQPALANLRFVEADAISWCAKFIACASPVAFDEIAINFPYGALLRACIAAEDHFVASLVRMLRPSGHLAIRLNARALTDSAPGIGWEEALSNLANAMNTHNLQDVAMTAMPVREVRMFPSTWAKRIGWGRPTEVTCITACTRAPQINAQKRSRIDIPCYD